MAIAIHTRLHQFRPVSRSAIPADLGSFLCPVCFAHLYGARGIGASPCEHVALVQDQLEDVYWRDEAVRALSARARWLASAKGGRPIDILQEKLGSSFLVYELIERPAGRGEASVVAFVIECAKDVPRFAPRRAA